MSIFPHWVKVSFVISAALSVLTPRLLAHNVNLSAKAIVALGAFGRLCQMRGDPAQASEFTELAHALAARWAKEADDGNHFRLAFDQPGTFITEAAK